MRKGYALLTLALLFGCALQLGCCMCANSFDQHYPAYGGLRPRVDMTCGRVGSAFRDAATAPASDGEAYQDEAELGEPGEPYDEYSAPYEDPQLYDEQLPSFDEGYYDQSPEDGPVEQLPTPAAGDPLDMGQPGPNLNDDLQLPELQDLDAVLESNTTLLP